MMEKRASVCFQMAKNVVPGPFIGANAGKNILIVPKRATLSL
jgi:hypothetical protein